MTNRERILSVLEGRLPDRVPFMPRLKLWYGARVATDSMPKQWKDLSLRDIERDLGLVTPARDGKVFDVVYDGVDIRESTRGEEHVTEYHTPAGSLRTVQRVTSEFKRLDLGATVTEHLLKGPADFKVFEWITEHTRWVETPEAFADYDAEIGHDGLSMVSAGDVPFHRFAQALSGYEQAYFHLADYPREVEHLLSVMEEVERDRMWPVLARSSCRLVLHGVHLSSQFTPPKLFRKYLLPYYRDFTALMHAHDKWVVMHGDNDTSLILDEIEDAGWDMVECFATQPMAAVTLKSARERWGDRVVINGGLPSVLLSPSVTEERFRQAMEEILRDIAPGNAFILGVSDNVMPDSIIERVQWASEFLARRGM